jgi:hypothetical protein
VHEEADGGADGRHLHRGLLGLGGGAAGRAAGLRELALELERAEEAGDEEEVVVVHPHDVAGLVDVEDRLREARIGGGVRGPVRVRGRVLGRDVLPEQVVHQRPERCGGASAFCGLRGAGPDEKSETVIRVDSPMRRQAPVAPRAVPKRKA